MSLFRPAGVLTALAIGLSAGCQGRDEAKRPRVTVLAAASTTDLMTEFANDFESKTGVTVDVATGPSNGLARQILAGAPGDVFVSANSEWTEALAEKELVEREIPLLINRLVLIVPVGNPGKVRSLADLTNEIVERVALAGENVPAGQYAEAALRYHDLYEPLISSGKIVRGHDVRVTLGYVERREVEAGIVYATDARVSDDVVLVETIDPAWHPPIRYPTVLLRHASPEGREFYDALISPGNAGLFAEYGFIFGSPAGETL